MSPGLLPELVEENIMMKYGFFIGSANLPLSEELKMKQKNKKHQVSPSGAQEALIWG